MTPELAMIANVVTKARNRVDGALEPVPSDPSAQMVTNMIAGAARRVFTAWDQLDPLLMTFASRIADMRANDRLTPEAQRGDIATLTTTTNTQLATLVDTMRDEAVCCI